MREVWSVAYHSWFVNCEVWHEMLNKWRVLNDVCSTIIHTQQWFQAGIWGQEENWHVGCWWFWSMTCDEWLSPAMCRSNGFVRSQLSLIARKRCGCLGRLALGLFRWAFWWLMFRFYVSWHGCSEFMVFVFVQYAPALTACNDSGATREGSIFQVTIDDIVVTVASLMLLVLPMLMSLQAWTWLW